MLTCNVLLAGCNPGGTTSVAPEDVMLLPVAQQMLINNSSELCMLHSKPLL